MTSGTFTFPQNIRQGGQHHRGQSIRSSGYSPLAVNAAVRAQTQEPDKYGVDSWSHHWLGCELGQDI